MLVGDGEKLLLLLLNNFFDIGVVLIGVMLIGVILIHSRSVENIFSLEESRISMSLSQSSSTTAFLFLPRLVEITHFQKNGMKSFEQA